MATLLSWSAWTKFPAFCKKLLFSGSKKVFLLAFFVQIRNRFGGNWITNKGETEGAQCTPPAYMVPKDPSLNRVNNYRFYMNSRQKHKEWHEIKEFSKS